MKPANPFDVTIERVAHCKINLERLPKSGQSKRKSIAKGEIKKEKAVEIRRKVSEKQAKSPSMK